MFKDYDDVKEKYWQGWVGEEVAGMLAASGFKCLGFVDNDFRWLTNSKRPVNNLEDLRGLTIRVPETEFLIDFFNRIGALPTPIAWGELATALQQGVVDGQDNGVFAVEMAGFHEFNRYITISNHSYSSHAIVTSQEQFDALSSQQQEDLISAITFAAEEQQDYVVNQMRPASVEKLMEIEGLEIIENNDNLHAQLVTVGKEMANSERWLGLFGKELVERMYP
jgi:TRAP-type C4-dicarboxylate transport system substrate-binding protein